MAVSASVFKNLGKSVAYTSLDVATSLMPNTAELTRGVRSGVDATRDFVRTNAAKLQLAARQTDRTPASKRARSFIEQAWADIKQGNLALGDLADESYDDFSSFMDDTNSQISYSDQDVQDQEKGQDIQAEGGKKLISTDFRTIKGLRHMTDTLGKTQIKVAEYQTEQITNTIFASMSMQQMHFGNIERQLDAINKNLIQLVKFQSESQSATNQAQLAFFDQMTSWMKKDDKRKADLSRRTRRSTRSKAQQFLGNQWFDANQYRELVKENFSNSELGLASTMLGMIDPSLLAMAVGGGGIGGRIQPQRFLLNALIKAATPRGARRSMRRMDNQVNTILKTALSRAGSYWSTPGAANHPLLSMLGSIFGVDTTQRRSLRTSGFKREDMNWNGEAQHVLVNVIPKQLSEIKSAITNQRVQYYDSQTGKFLNEDQVRERTRRNFQRAVESPFANMFNRGAITLNPDDVANEKYWNALSEDIQDRINTIVNDAVMSSAGLTSDMARQMDQIINEHIRELGGTVTDTQRIVTTLAEGVNQARSQVADFISELQSQDTAFSQIASDLANENGVISFDKLMSYLNADSINLRAASGGRYSFNGRRLDEMTPEERRKLDQQLGNIGKARDWIKNLRNSNSRFGRAVGGVLNRAYDRYTGANPTGYAARMARGIDTVSNQLYRAGMLGEDINFPFGRRRRGAPTPGAPVSPSDIITLTGAPSYNSPSPGGSSASSAATEGGPNGGIRNIAMDMTENEMNRTPEGQTANNTEQIAQVVDEALGRRGYLNRIFNSPVFKRAWEWFSKTKVGQAAKAGAGRVARGARDTLKKLFTEDYVDEEGQAHTSVASNLKAAGLKYTKFIAKMLGIDLQTGEAAEGEEARGTVAETIQNVSADIEAAGETITGESSAEAPRSEGQRRQKAADLRKKIMGSLNKVVNKYGRRVLTGGIAGAAVGAAMGGSTGLLGSMFLPGGPVGGAIAGMGISILSQTETFQRIMFGDKDPETGERDGGLISKNVRNFFKANIKKIVGGATAGVALKLLGGALGGGGLVGKTIGFIPNMLMPGGLIGAAIMGSAGALMFKNESFMKTLFGEKDEDGRRSGTALSGIYNKITQSIKNRKRVDSKSMTGKMLAAAKGAGVGALTAATISQFGLLGSMVTPGGPIGGAIVGAALGLTGVGDKLESWLFGSKDAEGKRQKDGLFSRLGKAIELNVVDPAKNWIKYTGEEMAWWLKEKVEVPFRLAFGPILDGFHNVKEVMVDTAKEGVNKIASIVGGTIKAILSPIGKMFMNGVLKPLGRVAGGLMKGGLFAAGSLLGSPFQLMSLFTSRARRRGNKRFGQFLRENKEANLQARWARQREAGEDVNEFSDRLMYNLATLPGIGTFFRNRSNEVIPEMAGFYEDSPEGSGRNSLNWLTAKADARSYKRNRKAIQKEEREMRRITRLRQQFAAKDKFNEAMDYGLMDPKELRNRYKALKRLGIDISSPEELKQFTYHYDAWKNPEQAAQAAAAASPTGEIRQKVVSINDILGKIYTRMGSILDINKAQLDTDTGSVFDTDDVGPGEAAEEIDEQKAREIQQNRARTLAGALAEEQAKQRREAERAAEHARVTGNTSGNAHDATDTHIEYDEEGNPIVVPNDTEEEKDEGSGGFLSHLAGSAAGSVVGKIFGGLFSKAGLITGGVLLLGTILKNPEIRTALGNLLGDVITGLPKFVAGGIKGLGKTILQLLGLDSGEGDGSTFGGRDYKDPETGEEKSVFNENVATGAASITLHPQSAAKLATKLPGGKTAAKVAGAAGKVASNVGASWGLAKEITKKEISSEGAGLLTKAFSFIQTCLNKLINTKMGQYASKVLTPIKSFFDTVLKKLTGASDDLVKLIASKSPKLAAALAKAGVTAGAGAATAGILTAVLAAYGAINGAVNAASLFKIDSDMVDWKMRLISGVIEALVNATGVGGVIAIVNEITTAAFNIDFMQSTACVIYHAISDEEDQAKLEDAISDFEKEVANYNQATGNDISIDAYNDLKNKSLLSRAWNGIKNIFGKGDQTDYSQYEVGNYQPSTETTASSSTGYGTGPKVPTVTGKKNAYYGPGSNRQDDARWGGMSLGNFPNGKKSTMATGGCGPTALSNAANFLGLGTNPAQVGAYAKNAGYIAQGGATDGLFDQGASALGLQTSRVSSERDIANSLRHGRPVIMAGTSSGYGPTPYTGAGHIVTATGLDGNGNVVIQDPMRGTGKYKLKDMQKRMTAGWSVARGYGLFDSMFGGALSALATGGAATLWSKLTGVDYSTAKSQMAAGATDSANDTENASAPVMSSNAKINLSGNDNLEKIWNALISMGFAPLSAAGLMGCWQMESGNRPDRIEGDFLQGFPGFNQVMQNNTTLDNYCVNFLFPKYKEGTINKEAYKYQGHYYPGMGLAQWTGVRGWRLQNYAKQNGGDWRTLETQLGYASWEFGKNNLAWLVNQKKTIEDTTAYCMDVYEMFDGAHTKLASQYQERLNAAKQIYNRFKNKEGTKQKASKNASTVKYGRGPRARGYGVFDQIGSALSKGVSSLFGSLGLSQDTSSYDTSGDMGTIDPSQPFTGSGIVYPATGNAKVDQNNLVKQMASLINPATGEGTISYSLEGGKQDPDKGAASCASTVAWAYNKVLGFKPGGSGFASSTSQSKDSRFTTIYSNTGKNPLDVSVLQPGDIIYQNWDRTSNNGKMHHTEMYAGGGKDLSHGGSPEMGPAYKTLNDYRKKHTMLVRRYTPFITSGDDEEETDQDATVNYGVGPNGDFSINTSGRYQHQDALLTGYGPGAAQTGSSRGVENRLDTIITYMRMITDRMSKTPASSSITNNTVNYGPALQQTTTKPTVVVQENRQLGEKDASNEYLRTQHRKLAAAIHD